MINMTGSTSLLFNVYNKKVFKAFQLSFLYRIDKWESLRKKRGSIKLRILSQLSVEIPTMAMMFYNSYGLFCQGTGKQIKCMRIA